MRMQSQRRQVILPLCLFLMLTLILSVLPADAVAEAAPESFTVGAAYLCCLDTNTVLYEKNAKTTLYPASTVKIMTGLLACRLLSDRMDQTVTLTSAMVDGVTGRNLHLAVGEVLTIRDLLFAALCGCYNDAANALAVLASGSVSAFVEAMNRESQRLGCQTTVFTNPTGMHDDAMVTTAGDVALIAREAYGNELFMAATSTPSYTIPATNVSEERTVYNRNLLLSDTSQNYRNGYCRGMSAGMTDEGGWCVVTVYERGGVSLLSVVMGGADVATGEIIPAYSYTNSLLSWANRNFGYVEVLAPGALLDTLPVGMTGISSSKADLTVPEGLYAYLPSDADREKDLSVTYTLTDRKLTAPLQAGEKVGIVTVQYGGEVVGISSLTVEEDFSESGFLLAMVSFRNYLTSRPFFASVVFFLLLLFLYIRLWHQPKGRYGVRNMKNRRRRGR